MKTPTLPRAFSLLATACILSAALPAVGASEPGTGTTLMTKGNYRDGRAALQRAFKRNPINPRVRYAYATSLTDLSLAQPLYASIAADTSAPDSIRGLACERLGGILYLKSEYSAASEHYGRASVLLKNPGFALRQALSLINAGSFAMAREVLAAMIDDTGATGREAWYLRGRIHTAADSCEKAADAYGRSLTGDATPSWKAPALAQKLACETKLGRTADAEKTRRDLAALYPDYLEKRSVHAVATAKPVTAGHDSPASVRTTDPSPADTGVWEQGPAPAYTLQVGSFGSAVNAQNQRDRLAKEFANTRIESYHLKGTTFYRLRIGSFPSKDDAESYARKNLSPRKISYSIILQ